MRNQIIISLGRERAQMLNVFSQPCRLRITLAFSDHQPVHNDRSYGHLICPLIHFHSSAE